MARWMVIISLSLATSGWSHWDHWLQLPASELTSHHPGSSRMKQHHLSLDPNATPDSTSLIWLKARMKSWIFWSSSATSAAPPRTWHHLVQAFMSPCSRLRLKASCLSFGDMFQFKKKRSPPIYHQFRLVHQLRFSSIPLHLRLQLQAGLGLEISEHSQFPERGAWNWIWDAIHTFIIIQPYFWDFWDTQIDHSEE